MTDSNEQSDTPSSPLTLDSMPNEIQQNIFGYVLRSEDSLVKTPLRIYGQSWQPGWSTRFNTALFTVNKQVSANAQVIFFKANTFRINHSNNAIHHADIRHLQLHGEFSKSLCEAGLLDPSTIALFLIPPKLQTLNISVERLHKQQKTVRAFVGDDARWKALTCIGFGVFELEPAAEFIAGLRGVTTSPRPKIYLHDRSLARTIGLLHGAGPLSIKRDAAYLLKRRLGCTAKFGEVYELAWWLRSYEDYRKLSADPVGHSLSSEEVEGARDFAQRRLITPRGLQNTNDLLPKDTTLADVVAGEGYPAELVEWAAELLGANMWQRY